MVQSATEDGSYETAGGTKAKTTKTQQFDAGEIDKLKLVNCFSPEVFKKDAMLSLAYFTRDILLAGSTIAVIYHIKDKEGFFKFLLPVLQFVAGFFMWCIFVSVHDAGHGSFSNSDMLNQIVGEFGNSICLCTPFYCWKLSHTRHHQYHHHIDKDYSYQWIPESEHKNHNYLAYALRELLPFIGWPMYLFVGQPDGGHLILYGRNVEGRSWPSYLRMWMSAIITMCSMFTIGYKLGWDAITVYVGPWIWYGWWLVTVTYLQHHDDDTKVFTDETWNFKRAAFETRDRTYGLGIDNFSHNITDGHVVHHLFYSKIPHYNLRQATKELKICLEKAGMLHLYKHRNTPLFFLEIFTKFWKNFFIIKDEDLIGSTKKQN